MTHSKTTETTYEVSFLAVVKALQRAGHLIPDKPSNACLTAAHVECSSWINGVVDAKLLLRWKQTEKPDLVLEDVS